MHSLCIESEKPDYVVANYYDKNGLEVKQDDPNLAAKIVVGGFSGQPLYYALFATEGGDRNEMYNTSSPHYIASNTIAENKAKYEFRKIGKAAFNFYLAYLRTGVPANIYRAMREV